MRNRLKSLKHSNGVSALTAPVRAVALAVLAAITGAAFVSPAEAASDNHLYTLANDSTQGSNVTALVKGSDGAFYGAAETMNVNSSSVLGGGAIFRLGTDGSYTLIHALDNFSYNDEINNDGIFPSGLIAGSDGAFYGFAEAGGSGSTGTVFRVTTDGSYTVLHTFAAFDACQCKTNTGGASPVSLTFGSDGALYGIAQYGGPSGFGTFFKLTLDGTYTDLRDFTDVRPAHLIAGADGNLYGSGYGLGTNIGYYIFRLSPSGAYTVLHTLNSTIEGDFVGTMLYGSDGNLYVGTGSNEDFLNADGNGVILRVALDGTTTLLHSFAPQLSHLVWQGILYGGWVRSPLFLNSEGAAPASLLQAADGTLYGALADEGPENGGSIFSMAPDGSNFNVLHTYGHNTPEVSANPRVMADAGDGSVVVATSDNAFFNLQPAAPLTVTASFSPSTVALYKSSKLTWSSTGAASCKISGDYLNTLKTATATSGSRTVWTFSTKTRLPAEFFAVVNCVSADGKSVANTTATLTVQ